MFYLYFLLKFDRPYKISLYGYLMNFKIIDYLNQMCSD